MIVAVKAVVAAVCVVVVALFGEGDAGGHIFVAQGVGMKRRGGDEGDEDEDELQVHGSAPHDAGCSGHGGGSRRCGEKGARGRKAGGVGVKAGRAGSVGVLIRQTVLLACGQRVESAT